MIKTEEKKKILIINLARMGDLLQTTPLIVGLKEKYPSSEITLLVSNVFAEICKGFPLVDNIHILDIAKIKNDMISKEHSLVAIYRYLENQIELLKKEKFDLVVNIVFSKKSVGITYLLEPPEIVGFTMDGYGHRVIKSPWINYFMNKLFNREYNLFNLVDVMQRSSGISAGPKKLFYKISEDERTFADEFLKKHRISGNDMVIGFQPGASKELRQWPTLYFSKLGNTLIKKYNAKLFLFGTAKEKGLGEDIEKNMEGGRVINLIGKTSLNELAPLLKRCDYLITGDTGTMHLATAVGTMVIALFFGSAYCFETGPYGEGHIVIQADLPCAPCYQNIDCKSPKCRTAIKPEDVIRGIELSKELTLNKGTGVVDKEIGSQANMFFSRFDENHFLEFLPLTRKSLKKTDMYSYCYKEVWQRALGSEIERPVNVDNLIEKICLHFKADDNDNIFLNSIKEDMVSLEKLIEMSSKGMELSSSLIKIVSHSDFKKNLQLIKDIGTELESLDGEIFSLGTVNKFIYPFTFMFKVGKENLTGQDMLSLSKDTFNLYDSLHRESRLMSELVRRISSGIFKSGRLNVKKAG